MKNANKILEAISAATQSGFGDTAAWYDFKETNDLCNEGVKLGWALRPSHTQIEWTEAGIAAHRAEKARQFFAAAVALVSFELSKDLIEYKVGYKTDNAYGLDGAGIWLVLYEKKEFWFSFEDDGLCEVTNAADYQAFAAELTQYLAKKRAQI